MFSGHSRAQFRPTAPRIDRLAIAAMGVALVVYRLTLAPDLTWANAASDGGELITASVTLGVAHPPGYPTYLLLGKLFSFLPLGTVAFRYNLFSAVCAAIATGLLAAAIHEFWRPRVRPITSFTAALAFAFLPLVWGQAVVAEVYSLNLLLVAAFLLAWSQRRAATAGLLLGLALTTHLTSALLLPAALLGGERPRRLVAGLVVGLAPLLLLPWLASGDSPVVWGRPDTPAGWLWLVSGRLYGANLQFPPTSDRLAALLRALAFGAATVAGSAVTPTGAALRQLNHVGTGTRAALLAGTAVLYALFAAAYATPDAAVLLLPGLLLLALLLAPALERLGLAALFLPLALIVAGHSGQIRAHRAGPRLAAEALLSDAPANALLLAPGDRTIFTLWYFQHVESLRPDLRLADASLFAFDWYRERLAALNPDVRVPAADDLAALQRLNETRRPFCTISLIDSPRPLPATGNTSHPGAPPTPMMNCTEERY